MTDISTIMHGAEDTGDGMIGVTAKDFHDAADEIDALRARLAAITDHLADGLAFISEAADKTGEALQAFAKAAKELRK